MALRVFTDPDGRSWQVWSVVPGEQIGFERTLGHLPDAMSGGWLCFESASEKGRLFPIPQGWEQRADGELWLLCGAAAPMRRRPAAPRAEAA